MEKKQLSTDSALRGKKNPAAIPKKQINNNLNYSNTSGSLK